MILIEFIFRAPMDGRRFLHKTGIEKRSQIDSVDAERNRGDAERHLRTTGR